MAPPKKKPGAAKKKPARKRSQKVNKPPRPETAAPEEFSPERKADAFKKVICFNMECKLRRAGCYGYEACPGFKTKG